jgi:hypothetical protein
MEFCYFQLHLKLLFNYIFYQCNNFNLSLIPLSIFVGTTYKDGLRMVPCTETCRHNKIIGILEFRILRVC